MALNNIRHTVLLLVYNQELLVKEALDSIFNQNIRPFEVLIGNDCSTDNTSHVLESYRLKFPEIIKVYNHEINLGIYKNQNFLISKINGDVVSFLSGDDIFKGNIFNELNRVIFDNCIDINSKFSIITNTSIINPTGKVYIWDNFNFRNDDLFGHRLRCTLNCRAVGISRNTLVNIPFTEENIGLHADWLWSMRFSSNSDFNYFTPFCSVEYRSGIGTVSKTKSINLYKSRLLVIEIIKREFFDKLNISDLKYLALETSFYNYQLDSSLKKYFKYIFYLIINFRNFNRLSIFSNYKVWIHVGFIRTYLKFINKL